MSRDSLTPAITFARRLQRSSFNDLRKRHDRLIAELAEINAQLDLLSRKVPATEIPLADLQERLRRLQHTSNETRAAATADGAA